MSAMLAYYVGDKLKCFRFLILGSTANEVIENALAVNMT